MLYKRDLWSTCHDNWSIFNDVSLSNDNVLFSQMMLLYKRDVLSTCHDGWLTHNDDWYINGNVLFSEMSRCINVMSCQLAMMVG